MKRYSLNSIIGLVCLTIFSHQSVFAESLYQNSKKGMEAFEKGEYNKALDHYTAAQLEAPDTDEVFYNLGNAQYKTGDFDSALNNYSKVLSTENKELKQKAFYNLGNTYFRKGDYEESIKQYENAIKISPDDIDAKKNIEFVKKVIEQQKQQKKQNEDNKDNEDQKKQDQNKDKQDQNKQQDQQQNQDNKEDQNKPEPKPDEQKKDGQQEKAEQQKDEKDIKDKKQAERMLNRLEDNPGKAMMPVYQNKKVEKDW